MSRKEFIEQLQGLLLDISEEERQAALEYYDRYFEEAGDASEQEVAARLGSPQKVAADIKMGMDCEETRSENSFYTRTGYQEAPFEAKWEEGWSRTLDEDKKERVSARFQRWWDRQSSLMRVVWLGLFLLVFFSVAEGVLGAALGIAGGAIGVFLKLIGVLAGLFAGAFAITLAFLVGAVGLFGTGIGKMFLAPAVGILYCGLGCLSAAAGILMCFVCIWLCGKVIPLIVGGIGGLFRKIFCGRRRER